MKVKITNLILSLMLCVSVACGSSNQVADDGNGGETANDQVTVKALDDKRAEVSIPKAMFGSSQSDIQNSSFDIFVNGTIWMSEDDPMKYYYTADEVVKFIVSNLDAQDTVILIIRPARGEALSFSRSFSSQPAIGSDGGDRPEPLPMYADETCGDSFKDGVKTQFATHLPIPTEPEVSPCAPAIEGQEPVLGDNPQNQPACGIELDIPQAELSVYQSFVVNQTRLDSDFIDPEGDSFGTLFQDIYSPVDGGTFFETLISYNDNVGYVIKQWEEHDSDINAQGLCMFTNRYTIRAEIRNGAIAIEYCREDYDYIGACEAPFYTEASVYQELAGVELNPAVE